MIIFEEQERFSPTTGKPTGSKSVPSHKVICDYCGKILDANEHYEFGWPEILYEIHETGGSEPSFDGLRPFSVNNQRFNLYDLFNDQPKFHFCCDWHSRHCDKELMREWMSENPGIFSGCCTISDAFWLARLRIIKKALEEGITQEQLGLTPDEF